MQLHDDLKHRYAREFAEIRDIYTTLYPDRQLNFVYYEGEDPMFGHPVVVEGDFIFQPSHTSAEYLGREALPAPFTGARSLTVLIAVPRAPNPGEWQSTEPDWMPRSRKVAALFSASPLGYEWLRYKAEMRRKSKAHQRHEWERLSRGGGARELLEYPASIVPDPDAQAAARPAILIGVHWLEVGGAENMARDTITWALEAGLRVFVVAGVPALQRMADRLPDHPDLRFIRLDRYLQAQDWPRYLANLATRENIRLIHIHHCVPLYNAIAHLRMMHPDIKVIDTTHIVEHGDGGYPRISGVWSNYIDMHHVISRELVDFYRDHFHTLDRARLGRMLTRSDTAAVLPEPNLTPDPKALHIAIVGRLVYQKRPVVIVECLRALAKWAKAKNITLSVTWVGEGPMSGAVDTLLRRYGLSETVVRKPAGTDVPALFESADILLLPSNNEGLALVCYEAIAHGTIPISSNVGSQSEIVPDDLLLPLDPVQAVKACVGAVDKLCHDPAFLARQGDAMRARYSAIMADPTAKELLMPIYQTVAAGAAPEF